MGTVKITQAEAERLLSMTKRSLVAEVKFPSLGKEEEFDLIGDTKKDIFAVNIFRGKINAFKYNIGARIKKNGILLLELHINPSNVHINPNGEKITGNHWHIYSEEYGRSWAFLAEDIDGDKFVENTIAFFVKFNVIEQPNLVFQLELI